MVREANLRERSSLSSNPTGISTPYRRFLPGTMLSGYPSIPQRGIDEMRNKRQ